MLLIPCPYCRSARPEIEFRYAGEAHIARPVDPSSVSDADWSQYLYMRTNPKGTHAERWRHIHGCGRFFNCLRDTVSDKILATYMAGEPQPANTAPASRDVASAPADEAMGRRLPNGLDHTGSGVNGR